MKTEKTEIVQCLYGNVSFFTYSCLGRKDLKQVAGAFISEGKSIVTMLFTGLLPIVGMIGVGIMGIKFVANNQEAPKGAINFCIGYLILWVGRTMFA